VATISAGGGIDSYTVLMLHADGVNGSTTFTDSSLTTPHTVTANGNAQINTAQFKFASASGYFDADGDCLTIPDDADFDLSGGVWTIDFWVRKGISAGNLVSYYQETDANNYFKIDLKNMGLDLSYVPRLSIVSGSSTIVSLTGTILLTHSVWDHIAVVENGNTYTVYVNGVSAGSVSDTDRPANYTGGVNIGYASSGNYMAGNLDEFRISQGIARGTSTYRLDLQRFIMPPLTLPCRLSEISGMGLRVPLQNVSNMMGHFTQIILHMLLTIP
jgi:hypothetical protein